jgi:hypothetical protein
VRVSPKAPIKSFPSPPFRPQTLLRAETASRREEGSQKIGAGWATPQAGQAKVGHFSSFAQIFQLRL